MANYSSLDKSVHHNLDTSAFDDFCWYHIGSLSLLSSSAPFSFKLLFMCKSNRRGNNNDSTYDIGSSKVTYNKYDAAILTVA